MIKKLLCRLGYHSPVIEPTISLNKDTKETKFIVTHGILICKYCKKELGKLIIDVRG
jgi:hypothetical protein